MFALSVRRTTGQRERRTGHEDLVENGRNEAVKAQNLMLMFKKGENIELVRREQILGNEHGVPNG